MTLHQRTGKLWLNVVGSTPNGQTEPNSTPGYEQVFALNRADDGGYDDYEGNQPIGVRYLTPFARTLAHPVIQYKTDTFDDAGQMRFIDSVERSAGVVTVTTASPHPFRVGQAVSVDGSGALSGTYVVRAVPTSVTFTAAATGEAATETGPDREGVEYDHLLLVRFLLFSDAARLLGVGQGAGKYNSRDQGRATCES